MKLNRWAKNLITNLDALRQGYVWFQVAYTTRDQEPEPDDSVYQVKFLPENKLSFWTYVAADDALQATIDANVDYEVLTLVGLNLFSWLTTGISFRAFYVEFKDPAILEPEPPEEEPKWVASARLN